MKRLVLILLASLLLAPTMLGFQTYNIPFNPSGSDFCGGTCPTSANGIDFPGSYSNDDWEYFQIADNPAAYEFLSTEDWTVGMWIRFDTTGSQENFFTMWDSNSGPANRQLLFKKDSSDNLDIGYDNSGNRIVDVASFSSGAWYFIALTNDISDATEYTAWVYNSSCVSQGTDSAGAENDQVDSPRSDIGAGASQLDTDPPQNEFNGQIAYLFYFKASWETADVANACDTGAKICTEMETQNTAGDLEWFYPMDGEDYSDCSDNGVTATEETDTAAGDLLAYGSNGPYG